MKSGRTGLWRHKHQAADILARGGSISLCRHCLVYFLQAEQTESENRETEEKGIKKVRNIHYTQQGCMSNMGHQNWLGFRIFWKKSVHSTSEWQELHLILLHHILNIMKKSCHFPIIQISLVDQRSMSQRRAVLKLMLFNETAVTQESWECIWVVWASHDSLWWEGRGVRRASLFWDEAVLTLIPFQHLLRGKPRLLNKATWPETGGGLCSLLQ